MEQESDSEAWDSELDDIPLVMDDESCSEASGAYSARSLAGSEAGGGGNSSRSSARGQSSSRHSRHRSLSSENRLAVSDSSNPTVPSSGASEATRLSLGKPGQMQQQGRSSTVTSFSLPLGDLHGNACNDSNSFSSPKPPRSPAVATVLSANSSEAATTAKPLGLSASSPMKMQLNLPHNSSSSGDAAAALADTSAPAQARIPSLNLPGLHQGSTSECAAAGARGKPPPLALFSNNSASPASSPHVLSGRNSSSSNTSVGLPLNLNLNLPHSNWAGVSAFGASAGAGAASSADDQQLVQVQLLLPAIDVYLPLQPAGQHAAAGSCAGMSRLGSGSAAAAAGGSGQFKRSGSKLARSSSGGGAQQQPGSAAAEDTTQPHQQQWATVQSVADSLQQAISQSIGVDQRHLLFYALQPAELPALLQPPSALQQQQQRKSQQQQQQHAKMQQQQPGSAAGAAAMPGVYQVVVGMQGCSFTLAALEGVLRAAEQQTADAAAARSELQQLQDELVLVKLRASEAAADLGRMTAAHTALQHQLEQTRLAFEAERSKSAALQAELKDAGSTILKIKSEYEAVKAVRSHKGLRSCGSSGGGSSSSSGSPPKSSLLAAAAAAITVGSPTKAGPQGSTPLPLAAVAATAAGGEGMAWQQQQQQGDPAAMSAFHALLQNPDTAALIHRMTQPHVMSNMARMLAVVEHMPTFFNTQQQDEATLMPPPPPVPILAASMVTPPPAAAVGGECGGGSSARSSWSSSYGMNNVPLSARGAGCSTPRDPVALAAAAAAAAAVVSSSSGGGGSGNSTARARRSSSSTSARGTPRLATAAAAAPAVPPVLPPVVPPLAVSLTSLNLSGNPSQGQGCSSSSSRDCRGGAAAAAAAVTDAGAGSARTTSSSNTPRQAQFC